MSKPDIRVRLSAEGAREVINLIRQVKAEGQSAERSSRTLSSAAGILRTSLGTLGVAASVTGVVAFGKAAYTSASQATNFAKTLGITTEEFTRLAYAANQADIGQDSFATGMVAYQKRLSEAVTEPNGEAAKSFRQLGLDAASLKDRSLTDQLGLIADRISAIPNPADRARASADFFGRSVGSQFVRVLNGGAEGIAALGAEADRLHITLSTKTANSIDRTDAAIKRLKGTVNGLARGGLGAVAEFLVPETSVDGEIQELRNKRAGAERDLAMPNLTGEAREREQQRLDGIIKQLRELEAVQIRLREESENAWWLKRGAGQGLLPGDTKASKATADAARAQVDSQLKITQEGLKAQEAAAKDYYSRGLSSLSTYYTSRRALVEADAAAEIRAAQAKLAIVEATPAEDDEAKAQRAKDIEQLRAQIQLQRLQASRELAQLTSEEIAEQEKLARAQQGLYSELDELEGKRHAAFVRNLAREVEDLRKLLKQAGASEAEVSAAADRLSRARTASFNLDEVQRSSSAAMEAFNRDAAQIRRDQEGGLLTQYQAEKRLIDLERDRIVVLREQAATLQAAAYATGNEENIARAKEFSASVDEIAASLRSATDATSKLQQGLESGLQGGFENLVSDAVMLKIRSFGDAFNVLAGTVQRAIAQVIAELASKQLISALSNLFTMLGGIGGGGSSFLGAGYGGGGTAMAARGGELRRLAQGGAVDARGGGQLNGPGTPTSDSMLLWGSNKEFMVRAAAAQQPGGVAFLNAFNEGRITMGQIRGAIAGLQASRGMHLSIPRFASGGALDGVRTSAAAGGWREGGIRVDMTLNPAPGTDSAAFQAMMDRAKREIIESARVLVAEDAARGRGVWGRF